MNNNQPSHEVIVTGIHLDLTPSIKAYVQEKMERLFRHQERIVRIRVELACDSKQIPSQKFTAKGHIMIAGPDLNASVVADECYKSIDMLVDMLDTLLRKRAVGTKEKRKITHGTEWNDVELPKAV
jgi:putative sigma-54 modulation protein